MCLHSKHSSVVPYIMDMMYQPHAVTQACFYTTECKVGPPFESPTCVCVYVCPSLIVENYNDNYKQNTNLDRYVQK